MRSPNVNYKNGGMTGVRDTNKDSKWLNGYEPSVTLVSPLCMLSLLRLGMPICIHHTHRMLGQGESRCSRSHSRIRPGRTDTVETCPDKRSCHQFKSPVWKWNTTASQLGVCHHLAVACHQSCYLYLYISPL